MYLQEFLKKENLTDRFILRFTEERMRYHHLKDAKPIKSIEEWFSIYGDNPGAIVEAFQWDWTPEGIDYWEGVHLRYQNYVYIEKHTVSKEWAERSDLLLKIQRILNGIFNKNESPKPVIYFFDLKLDHQECFWEDDSIIRLNWIGINQEGTPLCDITLDEKFRKKIPNKMCKRLSIDELSQNNLQRIYNTIEGSTKKFSC